jgi:hypothetical protein
MINDISKTIRFRFYNRFTKQDSVIVKMPYLPFWAISGYYSKLFRAMKIASAFNCDSRQIKGEISFASAKNDRTVIAFPSGLILDIPYGATEKDIKIINHHLEGLKMVVE